MICKCQRKEDQCSSNYKNKLFKKINYIIIRKIRKNLRELEKLIKEKGGLILIFFPLVLFICLSGCQIKECPDSDSGQVIPIGCIQRGSEYYNKTIMIHSKFLIRVNHTIAYEPSIIFGDEPAKILIDVSNATNSSILQDGNMYYFIGEYYQVFKVIEIRPG